MRFDKPAPCDTVSEFDNVRRHDRGKSPPDPADGSELLAGFVRLHVLHHAAKDGLVGFWMMEELRRHGYRVSSGTVYPLLHGLERRGYLRSRVKRSGRRSWREYRATANGRKALEAAKGKLRELFHELVEE
jgi:PadR family transcriptional regulator